ncbi:MAG: triose-phosphate isomerase [Planctomycetota bacterium]
MSRRLFIAGNWKMNTTLAEASALASGLAEKLGDCDAVDLGVAPPFVYLAAVREALGASGIALGAQNVFYEDKGAFTGETSAAMLTDVGCSFVIVGHSERRHVIGESDELINRKVLKGLSGGLHVILAVGELLEQREAEQTMEVVDRQVRVGLEGVSAADMANVTIAYEPVWAIGTGVTATPDQAQEVHAAIRGLLAKLYDTSVAEATRIQYGGSVKPSNAGELLSLPDVDGALVGGASLKVDDFAGIVEAGVALV